MTKHPATRAVVAQDAKKGGQRAWKPPMPERQLQELVRRTALAFGWRHYHTHNSRRSEAGFPDSVMVRGTRLIVAELKTERGKVTEAQAWWLAGFLLVPNVEIFVWRPSDWLSGAIEEVLR